MSYHISYYIIYIITLWLVGLSTVAMQKQ